MTSRASLCGLALVALGCAASGPATRSVWLPTYGFGAIGGGELDLRDVCPNGRAEELSIGSSWSTLGIAFITLGVYTPREATVRCGEP